MILLVHPTGNQFVRALLNGLYKSSLLSAFQTTVSYNNLILSSLFPKKFLKTAERRHYDLPKSKILTRNTIELQRLILKSKSIKDVYLDLDRYVADNLEKYKKKYNLKAVYCYEDGAEQTFIKAKSLGLKCFYELPIGHWKAAKDIQEKEALKNPEWAKTMPVLNDSTDWLRRKDIELELADSIFVPSTFVYKTLYQINGAQEKTHVVPFGINRQEVKVETRKDPNKLKCIFVGSLTQRKGISYLFEAMEELDDIAELTVIGKKTAEIEILNNYLKKHRWIESISHNEVLDELKNHDILIFPSIFEGYGLVILEAMSLGAIVITSENTGGKDCINDKVDSFLLKNNFIGEIREIVSFLQQNDKELLNIKINAKKTADKMTWQAYSEEIISIINKTLNDH